MMMVSSRDIPGSQPYCSVTERGTSSAEGTQPSRSDSSTTRNTGIPSSLHLGGGGGGGGGF